MVQMNPEPKALSTVMQLQRLRSQFPGGRGQSQGNVLTWTMELSPSELFRTFMVALKYNPSQLPEVRLKQPQLEQREGKRAPHLYPDGSLCLFYPKAREWNHRMWISESIIPWTSEWLFHYEIWLLTGEWEGGGIQHQPTRLPR